MSVLLPVRDAAETLGVCLASLAAQTLRDHEVIAVDDGSGDASRPLLEAAAREDRRVRVLRAPASGLVAALNHGLGAARAPLLARMDADDICAARRLELQAETLRAHPALDVLGCRVRLIGPAGRTGGGMAAYVDWLNSLIGHDQITRDLFVESPLAHPSVMMRTAALRALDGYRAFDGPEDYDLWLRAHQAGHRFGKHPEVLLDWRDSPHRLTRTSARYAPEKFRAVKIEALERGALAGRPPVVLWGAGPIGKGWARALLVRGHRLAAFVEVDPAKIGQTIAGAPVFDVERGAALAEAVHLAAVGQPGARGRIRAEAARRGREVIAVA